MVTAANAVTWRAGGPVISPGTPRPPSLDWGTMFSFSVTVNRAPTNGSSTLHVANSGSPTQYAVATLVPGS